MQYKGHHLKICFHGFPPAYFQTFSALNDTDTSLMCRTTEIHIKYLFTLSKIFPYKD